MNMPVNQPKRSENPGGAQQKNPDRGLRHSELITDNMDDRPGVWPDLTLTDGVDRAGQGLRYYFVAIPSESILSWALNSFTCGIT